MNSLSDQPPRRKLHRRYLFYRLYCAVVVLAWNGLGTATLIRHPEGEAWMLVMVPFVLPAIFMVLNLFAFRLPWSVFGPFERSSPPPENPQASYPATWGMIGLMHGTFPFFSYSAYKQGLGISVLGIGECYLPYKDITRVTKGLWSCGIRHRSKEMRTPICVPKSVGLMVIRLRNSAGQTAAK